MRKLDIEEVTTILFNYSYPKWEEIPDIDLYLDQVLLYVNKVCAPFISETDKGLTASMVNNYVKHGYLPKPDKKKYKRQQVARLIAITTLKTVFSIQEIAATLNLLQSQADSADLYNSFVDFLHEEKKPLAPIIESACRTVLLYQETLSYIHVHSEEEK